MTLTKSQIVLPAQKNLDPDHSQKQAREAVNALIEIIKQTLENGEDVLITGFGKFSVRHKKERLGRNPATEEPMMLSPRKVVTFKCSGKLKSRLNGKPR